MPIARVNNIDICYETSGDRDNPALLLINGFGSQLIDWDNAFCQLLADAGLFVIRLDNRDSGLSTHFNEFKQPNIEQGLAGDTSSIGYRLNDMAVDCIGLLDYLDIDAAHVFGVSMGGMIAQIMAIHFPERVKSLLLLSTTTGSLSVGQPTPEIQAAPFLRNHGDDVVSSGVESSGRWASWSLGTTELMLRARVQARFDRAYDPLTSPRQLVAIVAAPDRSRDLQNLHVPTIVVHGTDDPLVNVSGGQSLALLIPDAELILIEGMRHDIPAVIWPKLLEAVCRNVEVAG